MADRPVPTARSRGERRWLAAIGLIAALGAIGLGACSSGEGVAQDSPGPVSSGQTAPATPGGATGSDPTEKVDPSVVGAVDTTGLAPAAVAYAETVTPDRLFAMTPDDRLAALAITPDLYRGDLDVLSDLEFAQYAAIVGFATNKQLFADTPNDWQAMIDYGNQLMDTVYGIGVSARSEKAAGQFPFVAMRTYSLEGYREIATTESAKNVSSYRVVLRKTRGTTKVIGGDTDMSSATVEMRISIDAPVDYSALPNDPNISDPNSPAMGDGLPTKQPATLAFSGVMQRDGQVVPTAIVLGK